MEIILLEKVRNVGNLGDRVHVSNGYARNYLVPQGKAVQANRSNVAAFEMKRAELEAAAIASLAAAQTRAEQLAGFTLRIEVQAGDEGKLYGSISVREIAEAMAKAGKTVEKREVSLPGGPIRQTGEFPVNLLLHTDVVAPITVTVVAV